MKISEDENTITFPILKMVESDECDGCYFNRERALCDFVLCHPLERKDKKSVIFVEVDDENQ